MLEGPPALLCYHFAPMPLSWNEIRHRAIAFSREWNAARREQAEKQTFWNEFFNVFGVKRRVVASFEEPVKNLAGKYDFIDLFWPGKALVEHKSRGKDLGQAESQGAVDFIVPRRFAFCLPIANSLATLLRARPRRVVLPEGGV